MIKEPGPELGIIASVSEGLAVAVVALGFNVSLSRLIIDFNCRGIAGTIGYPRDIINLEMDG